MIAIGGAKRTNGKRALKMGGAKIIALAFSLATYGCGAQNAEKPEATITPSQPAKTVSLAVHADANLNAMGLAAQYQSAPWVSVHRDSSNSDHAPFATAANLKVLWSALDGAALINPGSINDKGVHFVASGRGEGFANLHAIDTDGKIIWETPVQRGPDDFDALAGFNAPVIDRAGDLYIGDSNQIWAFHPDGTVKWITPLPPGSGPFVYQVISRQGYVGGITAEGWVLFFNPSSGEAATKPFKLPTGVAPEKGPDLRGLWQGGLFDPDAAKMFEKIAFGFGVQVANAPAVHPESGRIFITAAGPKDGDDYSGVLYGLDIVGDEITVGFALKMAGGSGTSPALSPDGAYVYSAGGDGVILAVESATGKVAWSAQGEGLLSPAIGADGVIYTGDIFGDPTVIALSPKGGSQVWARSYSDYAKSRLPSLPPAPPLVENGDPVMRLVSVIAVSSNVVWAGLEIGYEYRPEGAPKPLTAPHISTMCALSIKNGDILHCTDVRDSLEGIINIDAGGRVYVSHTSIFSSTAYYGFNASLPERFRTPARPIGGLTALGPVSYCDQAKAEFETINDQLSEALSLSADNDLVGAQKALGRARSQLIMSARSAALDDVTTEAAPFREAVSQTLAAFEKTPELSVDEIAKLQDAMKAPACE